MFFQKLSLFNVFTYQNLVIKNPSIDQFESQPNNLT